MVQSSIAPSAKPSQLETPSKVPTNFQSFTDLRVFQFFTIEISVIYDYCAEGSITAEDNEATLDENAMLFAKSAQTLVEHNN